MFPSLEYMLPKHTSISMKGKTANRSIVPFKCMYYFFYIRESPYSDITTTISADNVEILFREEDFINSGFFFAKIMHFVETFE